MFSRVWSVKDSGSAPNFSWLASSRAPSMVKPPVIDAWPLRMASLNCGATMTLESRVAAIRLRGSSSETIRLLASAYSFEPSDLKDSWISTSLDGWPLLSGR